MAVILYALANIARAGATRSGYHSGKLLCQVGKRLRPCRSGIARSGATRMGLDTTITHFRRFSQKSLRITDTGQTEIPTADFTIRADYTDRPEEGNPVIIAIGTLQNRLFGGHLKEPKERQVVRTLCEYQCTAEGFQKDLRKRRVNEIYYNQWAGDILKDLLETYTVGFSWTGNIQRGAFIEEIVFNFENLFDVCNTLANLSEYVFYITPLKVVYFVETSKHAAPWAISDTEIYENLEVTPNSSELRTRIIIRYSNLEEITETFKGDGVQKKFQLAEMPHEIISLKVDGVDVTYDTKYVVDNSGNDFAIRYGVEKYIDTMAHATLTASNVLEIVYLGRHPARLILNDLDAQQASSVREGGDGIYDFLIEDREIVSYDDALAKAQDVLTHYAEVVQSASYRRKETVFAFCQHRLRVGMQQALTARGYNDLLSIEQIVVSVYRHEDNRNLGILQEVSLAPLKQTLTDVFQRLYQGITDQENAPVEVEEIVNI